jgi:uncharacterized membrane protein
MSLNKINLIAIFFCGLSCCLWMVIFADNFYAFRFGGLMDLTHTCQSLWNIPKGIFYSSIMGTNFLMDHATFWAFLLAPFYKIYPDPIFLFNLKMISFFAGAYIFFLILKKYLHPLIALGAMIVFTLTPANLSMLAFPFNYEILSIPLIFLIYKAFDDKNYPVYIVSCFLLCLVKEQMPLVVMMFGVLALFKKEGRVKWAIIPLIMGLTIFVGAEFFLMPYLGKATGVTNSPQWSRYMEYGETPLQILGFLLTHPMVVFKQFFKEENVRWYKEISGGWGALALFSPHILLPALPLILKTTFSNFIREKNIYWAFYGSTFTPFVFLATWNTLNYIRNRSRLWIHSLVLIIIFIHALANMSRWSYLLDPVKPTSYELAVQKFVRQIPPDASVVGTYRSLPFLANRKEIYSSSFLDGSYYMSHLKFVLPKHIDYLLLDLTERRGTHAFMKLNFDQRWTIKDSIEDIVLFRRRLNNEPSDRLVEVDNKSFLINGPHIMLDNTLSLEGINFPQDFSHLNRIFPVVIEWKSLQETKSSYDVLTGVKKEGKTIYSKRRPVGSTIYPTDVWKQGQYIKEKYFYLLPPLSQGEYTFETSVYASDRLVDCNPASSCDHSVYKTRFFVH